MTTRQLPPTRLRGVPIGLEHVAWPMAPLSVMFSHVDSRSVTGDERLLSITKTRGVIPRDEITDKEARADTLVGYKRCRQGDIVVNQMSAFEGLLGVSGWDGIVTYHYLVFRPNSPECDVRFYAYLLRTPIYILDFSRRVRGLGGADQSNVRTPHIRIGDWLKTVVPIPSLATQRAIADYLDRETARIDALIAAKRRMAELLEERWQGFLETKIRALADKYGEIPLKYVCREVVVGIVVTPSAWYADSGIPAIRGTNVSPGAISTDDLVYLTKEGHELHPKSRLRSGDVVVVRTGQAGVAAVVPPELDGVNCIDLVIIRLRRNYSAHFLEFVMNSDWMQKHVDEYSVGTIQSHFNVGAAGLVPVPRAPLAEQNVTVDELRRVRQRINGLVSVIERQVELLQERRRALVTAAVTGQLEIPEAI